MRTLDWFRKNWMIIIFIFSSVVIWTTQRNTVDGHTDEIKSLKLSDTIISSQNNQILVELAGIRSDLSWLKQNLNK